MTRTPDHTDGTETGEERRTLADIQHTNPHTGEAFGDTVTYDRGRTVAADGGAPGAADAPDGDDEDATDGEDPDRLRDVDHTPPGDVDDANNVYERGHEGRDGDR